MTRSSGSELAEDAGGIATRPGQRRTWKGFACHVIPTAVTRDGGDLSVCATLVFTPTVDRTLLATWPSGIVEKIEKLRLSVRPAGASSASVRELGRLENLHATRTKAASIDYAQLLKAVDALWSETIIAAQGAGSLERLLEESRKGGSRQELLATKNGTNTPDIVAVPRGDLALLYALQRAKTVADRAHEASRSSTDAPSKAAAARKLAATLSNDWIQRPWARLPNPLERAMPAAQDAARVPYNPFRYTEEPIDDAGKYARLRDALRAEHDALRPAVDKTLEAPRTAAADVARAKRAVAAVAVGARSEEIRNALRQFGRARAKGISADLASKTCVDDPKNFHGICDERLAQHVASSMPDADNDAEQTEGVESIRQRWMSVRTQPSLMRLFHLVVDVRCKLAKDHLDELAAGAGPAFLEFGIADAEGDEELWVLAKLVAPKDAHGSVGTLWPATRAEWLQAAIGQAGSTSDIRDYGAIDQIEGVYDLGATFLDTGDDGKPFPGGKRIRRFDVTSLDVFDAAEVTVQEHKTQATTIGEDQNLGDGLPEPESADVLGSRTRRTAGLMLLDRWRQSVAVSEFVKGFDGVGGVKDADDLMIGFKIDIGAFSGAPGAPSRSVASSWRSLTDRKVVMSLPSALASHAHVEPLQGNGLDRAISALSPTDAGLDKEATRRRLDGAIVTIASRLRGNGSASADAGRITAFTEEAVTAWDGDPLGLRAGEEAVAVGMGGLPIDMTFSLPTRSAAPSLAPHMLRLGAAYRFGARTVLVGGISRPLSDAARLYDSWLDGDGLSLPGLKSRELRRFLRHERVDAPMVAIEQTHLLTELASGRPPLDGKEMIVRSSSDPSIEDAWRYAPSETSRVLFAPPVSLSFSTWHGVFDGPAGSVSQATLLGGLSTIDYDAQWHGFPVLEADAPPLESSVRGEYRDVEKPDRSGLRAAKPPSGTAVLRKARISADKRRKENRYYPDPAARFMVIALKRPGGDYLEDAGDALCVPLYAGAKAAEGSLGGYPHAMPVIVKIRADRKAARPLTSYKALRARAKVKSDDGWPRAALDKSRALSPANAAVEVTIVLRPGEDFQVEAWCLPDKTLLARWFDVPESLAFLVGGSPVDGTCTDLQKCLTNFSCLTGADPSNLDHFRSTPSADPMANCVKGDCKATLDLVKGVAGTLFDLMKRRPIPEIAAVRRLRAVHAVEQPDDAPAFSTTGVKLLRVTSATRDGVFSNSALPNDDDGEGVERLQRLLDWKKWQPSDSEDGASDLLIGGEFSADVETTGGVELRATGAAARSQLMDDPSRGRSPTDRLAGVWSFLAGLPEATAGSSGSSSPTEQLFGFHVDRKGMVTLPTQTVRISEWILPNSGSTTGRQTFDMLGLSRAKKLVGQHFADGKARRLSLDLYATSRTALLIPSRASYPDASEDELDRRQLFRRSREPIHDLILRATTRPSAMKAQSLLPIFAWKADGPWLCRKTKIRIRCARPHFTSGVEERWGLVLWPPNMFDVKRGLWTSEKLRAGKMKRVEPVGPGEAESFDLLDAKAEQEAWREPFFSDEDLGKGGKYITRWGVDPIRKGGSLSWFLSPEALADETTSTGALKEKRAPAACNPTASALPIDVASPESEDTGTLWPSRESHRPRLVENVLMPIPIDEKSRTGTDADGHFMQVSLMTYEPRFDPDFEHWYVDVDIAPGLSVDPFLRLGIVRFQPHARRELQCSSPIAEWVQIVGHSRRVKVDVAADSSTRTAFITVSGAAPSDEDDEAQMSFRATLYERRQSPLGHVSERPVRSAASDDDEIGMLVAVSELGFQSGDNIWSGDLDLPDDDGATYAVLVEEVNRMRTAQYAVEPHDDGNDERKGSSGPRFAAFIDLAPEHEKQKPVTARF